MNPQAVDGQWLDFYALLEVPVNAEEDTVRKRIGKVYSDAAANCEHRDLSKRHYYQALVERVLPQCRRVLLDPEWRAKYDRQHILHSIEDPSAQDYVTFIASVRGVAPDTTSKNVSQRVQEEIRMAQTVVQTVQTGESLELLPTKSLSGKTQEEEVATLPTAGGEDPSRLPAMRGVSDVVATRKPSTANLPTKPSAPQAKTQEGVAQGTSPKKPEAQPSPGSRSAAPAHKLVKEESVPAPFVEVRGPGSFLGDTSPSIDAEALAAELDAAESGISSERLVQAKVITAQEANDIRRRRSSNPDGSLPLGVGHGPEKKKVPFSRVSVGDGDQDKNGRQRLISPTSINLMVAIVAVLLTGTVQKLAVQPAVATATGRMPLLVTHSPSLKPVLDEAAVAWEKTPEGSTVDVVVQSEDARAGLDRAMGKAGAANLPDVWIPSDSLWSEGYNQLAPARGRQTITMETALAQTPLVLIARSDKAGLLKKRFPSRNIGSWSALRQAVATGAKNRLGLTDPRRSATGSTARYSMAKEWSISNGKPMSQALTSSALWNWMGGFEENASATSLNSGEMVKDLALGTTGRFWWAIGYESDAISWMAQGKPLEIFYLPKTHYANHPYCYMNRVGASVETMGAQSAFETFLRSEVTQKSLLKHGLRPTEISLESRIEGNPFLDANLRRRGVRAGNLPRTERMDFNSVTALTQQWAKRFG